MHANREKKKTPDRHPGSHGTVLSLGTSQHPTLSFYSSPLPPSSPSCLNSSPPLHRSHHSAIFPLCCFLPLSLPRCVVIINTPSSWADIWLESVSSPVAGRIGGESVGRLGGIGSQVMRPFGLTLLDRGVLGNLIRAKALHLKYDWSAQRDDIIVGDISSKHAFRLSVRAHNYTNYCPLCAVVDFLVPND